LYFGPTERECFGWLHEPTGGPRHTMGLVICSPWGHEDLTAHRSLRHLAIATANRGVPTLRFDYHGSGDSAGAEEEHDHPSAWTRSVHDAIELLRTHAGVHRVSVFGLRLGATVGALAAATRHDVCAFAALAPVVSGRAWLRELRLRAEVGTIDGSSFDNGPTPLECAGFVVTPRAQDELRGIDLRRLDAAPAGTVLLLDRNDLPSDDAWATHLMQSGANVERRCWPGYAGMVSGTGSNVIPHESIAQLAEWVHAQTVAADAVASRPEASAPSSEPPRPTLELVRPDDRGFAVHETPIALHGPEALCAILSEPRHTTARRAVVLLNTGMARRIGPSRMYVTWARRWAAQGTAVLRLDLPGLGDSAVQPGEVESEVYACATHAAITAAMEHLRRRFGAIDCTLMALCSGAFHALEAAAAGVPARALVLINQATFHWRADMTLRDMPLSWRVAHALTERAADANAARWTAWRRAARLHAATLGFAALNRTRDATRFLRRPPHDDLGGKLRGLARRGVAIHCFFGHRERGTALLRLQGGHTVAALERRGELKVHVLASADHLFSTRASRSRLLEVLDTLVGAGTAPDQRAEPAAAPASAKAAAAATPTATSTSSISR
jgi:pimeloyl-ACP methyl ester carboxylesterase